MKVLSAIALAGLAAIVAVVAVRARSGALIAPPVESPARTVAATAADLEPVVTPQAVPHETLVRERPAAGAGEVSGAEGEVTLRIGEGFVFGGGLRPRSERDGVDMYCLDIRDGTKLRCPFGGAQAQAPMTAVGLPETGAGAAALLPDAPSEFAGRDVELAPRPLPEAPGLGFVRTRSGAVFKLWLIAQADDTDALERTVRIGFASVPAVDAGGVLQLAQVEGAPSAAMLQAIRTALDVGGCIPSDTFAKKLRHSFESVGVLGSETVLRGRRYLTVESLVNQGVELEEDGALFAGSLGRGASVVLRRGGAAGVAKDLDGVLRTDGYAYLFVGGDVLGTIDIRSYTTAVVLGDVRGSIRIRSYTSLYVRGRILGTIDWEGSGWCTFYLQSFLSRADLEQWRGTSQITLHLRVSDLPPGTHKGIGAWREIVVDDPLWARLAR